VMYRMLYAKYKRIYILRVNRNAQNATRRVGSFPSAKKQCAYTSIIKGTGLLNIRAPRNVVWILPIGEGRVAVLKLTVSIWR
jgi:hypothetical protein